MIPCGKRKFGISIQTTDRWKQKDVYISPFGKACQAYASMFFENWVILSAKHGFLRPNDIVLKKL
ncbi:DUF6884 domain-containing protein [Bacillus cereus]